MTASWDEVLDGFADHLEDQRRLVRAGRAAEVRPYRPAAVSEPLPPTSLERAWSLLGAARALEDEVAATAAAVAERLASLGREAATDAPPRFVDGMV